MPLESLLQLVETLRERIDTHRAALSQSEALTRYALIDPLLRELGWDTEDPTMVVPEYRSGRGSADYALLANGSPAMMVEAKKLGTPLHDSVLEQVLNYCMMEGTNHFSITDGAHWEIYETHRPVPIDQKRVVEFDLTHLSPAETSLKALVLWRLGVESGDVSPGQVPVVEITQTRPMVVHESPPPTIVHQIQPLDQHEWHPLTSVKDVTGQKPTGMLSPDGVVSELKYWTDLPVEAVRWLMTHGRLTPSNCPIQPDSPKATRYIVHTEPVHSDGKRFTQETEIGHFYLEGNHRANTHVRNTKLIINSVGEQPEDFKVRFS